MVSIDERIVRLRLDGNQFRSEAAGISKSLTGLKRELQFKDADTGAKNVSNALKSIDLSPVSKGLDAIDQRFSAMGVAAMTVVSRITNGAIDAGRRMVSAMTASVRDGFAEYETQMNSVQTILANTASKGTNLQQVNAALNELNTYADKTIYNFTEMTRNIGTFTAAGVDLKTSVSAIQGIANLAAVSGSTSQQASTAMYQLSQALATGTVKLMDWNSVVNAGMGGEVFQQALIRTSEHLQTGAKAAIEAEGSFRDSLQTGWLTTEVLTETLNQFSLAVDSAEEYDNAIKDLVGQGYTQEEAKAIADMAKTAGDAATKVKTFTQLIDTLKEALGSGWTQSWQTLIGDFEEAKDLWTTVSDSLSDIINTSSESRNQLLTSGLSSGWKQLLNEGIADSNRFEETMKDVARSHNVAVDDMISKTGSFEKSLGEGWVTADILRESIDKMATSMSEMSAEELKNQDLTSQNVADMNKLNESFKNGSLSAEEFSDKLAQVSGRQNLIAGLGNIFSSLGSIIKQVGSAWRDVFPAMTGEQLYGFTAAFRNFTDAIKPSAEQLDYIRRIAKGLFSVLDIGKSIISGVGQAIASAFGSDSFGGLVTNILKIGAGFGDWLTGLNEAIQRLGIFKGIGTAVGTVFASLFGVIKSALEGLGSFSDVLGRIASMVRDKVLSVFDKVSDALQTIATWIKENISIGDVFAGLAGGGIALAFKKIADLVGTVKDAFENFFDKGAEKAEKAVGSFSGILSQLGDSLEAFTGSIKAFTLLEIATAVYLLVKAMEKLGDLNIEQISQGIGSIGALMLLLNKSMKSLARTVDRFDTKGLGKTAIAMIAMAKAIQMLADAMVTMSSMSWDDIARGLTGVGGAIVELSAGMKFISGTKVPLRTSIAMLAMAETVKMISEPLIAMSKMSWEEVGRSLSAMGGALGELSAIMILMSKFSQKNFSSSIGLLIASKSLGDIADALKVFADNSWLEIGRGLSAMGGALTELGGILLLMGRLGKHKISSSVSLVIAAKSLGDIADAFGKFSAYDWGSIGRGLTAMGGALLEVGGVTTAMGKIGGLSSILGSISLNLVTDSLPKIAEAFGTFTVYDWGAIGRGLVAMGGALGEVGLITVGIGKLGGLAGVIGGVAINVVVQSLDELSSGFASFAHHDWDAIGRGLAAMGGALGEVGLITIGVGKLGGLSGLLGGATIWTTVQSLERLGESFGTFTSFSWDEIGRGLVAMGGALLEVGGISAGIGALSGLAGLLGAGTVWVAVQGLGDLADALRKFGEMDWDAIGRGLVAMGGALADVAIGSFLNTLSILGAASIATVSEPLGVLADSMQKWANVTVPDGLAEQLSSLADAVMSWTFSGIGSSAIATVAEPLGTLADSVQKWSGVTVPEGLGEKLKELSKGIAGFWNAFVGGWSMSQSAEPLGQLADSVKKWKDVKVPENIGSDLAKLSGGIQSFSLAFMGGFSMSTVVGPLGDLPESIKKWKDVSLPDTLETDLTSLANGVKAFSTAFVGGWSMGGITGPLGDMAVSASKWEGISLPPNIQSDMEALAAGVGAFWNKWGVGSNIASIAGPLGTLADSVRNWSTITIPEGLGEQFKSIATALKEFTGVSESSESLNTASSAMNAVTDAVVRMSGAPLSATGSDLQTFIDSLNNIPDVTSGLPEMLTAFANSVTTSIGTLASSIQTESTNIGNALSAMGNKISSSFDSANSNVGSKLSAIASTISGNTSAISSALSGISNTVTSFGTALNSAFDGVISIIGTKMTALVAKINSFKSSVQSAGTDVASSLETGLKSKASGYENVFNSGLNAVVAKIRSYRSSFSEAGGYAAAGFAEGIRSSISSAASAAAELASAASAAARKNLDIQSPSKVFRKIGNYVGQGFALGMEGTESMVVNSASHMASAASDAVEHSVKLIDDSLNRDLTYSTSIHPTLDVTPLKRQNAKMSSLLASTNATIRSTNRGITGIGTVQSTNDMLHRYQQDMHQSNNLITQSINGLRSDISKYNDINAHSETAMYLDGKKLASSIAKPMNQQLGVLSRRGKLS